MKAMEGEMAWVPYLYGRRKVGDVRSYVGYSKLLQVGCGETTPGSENFMLSLLSSLGTGLGFIVDLDPKQLSSTSVEAP